MLIGLAAAGKRNENKGSQVVWGPLNTKKKNGNSERYTNILCYKWNIYLVIWPGEQTLLMVFSSRMIFFAQNCQKWAPIVVILLLRFLPPNDGAARSIILKVTEIPSICPFVQPTTWRFESPTHGGVKNVDIEWIHMWLKFSLRAIWFSLTRGLV